MLFASNGLYGLKISAVFESDHRLEPSMLIPFANTSMPISVPGSIISLNLILISVYREILKSPGEGYVETTYGPSGYLLVSIVAQLLMRNIIPTDVQNNNLKICPMSIVAG